MAEPTTAEELTIAREGDERMAPRRELKKEILTTGAWSTVLYMYTELKRATKTKPEEWSAPKVSLVRYRKMKGVFKFKKEFAISNLDHARQMVDVVGKWLEEGVEVPPEAIPGDD